MTFPVRIVDQNGYPVVLQKNTGGALEIIEQHGDLQNLTADDHPQYAEIASAETISGDWTHTGAVVLPSGTSNPSSTKASIYYHDTPDTLFFYDDSRSKDLSAETMTLQFSNPSSSLGAHYLKFGDLVMTTTRGFYVPRIATIVGVAFAEAGSSSASVQIKSGAALVGTLGTYTGGRVSSLTTDIDILAATLYEIYVAGAASYETGSIYFKWRAA